MAYGPGFARVYDKFTEEADVQARADYLFSLLSRFGVTGGILLDLACGTGKLSEAFIKKGFDVIASDESDGMLWEAQRRLSSYGKKALLIRQDMRELDLFGTVNACVCSQDSVSHLLSEEDVLRVFERVSLFTEPGGVFIFDVNTEYKHREVLGDKTFVYEDENDFLVWQNEYDETDGTVGMLIDVFSGTDGGKYERFSQEIVERAYPVQTLTELLYRSGFSAVRVFGDRKTTPPEPTEERIYFAAVK